MKREDVVKVTVESDAWLRRKLKLSDDITLLYCWERFARNKGKRSTSHQTRLRGLFKEIAAFGALPMKEIDSSHLLPAVKRISARQSDKTFQVNIRALRSFFSYCVLNGWYLENPLKPYSMAKVTSKTFFTPERLKIIAKLSSPRLKGVLGIMYATGCSLSELRSLDRHMTGWVTIGKRTIRETPALAKVLDRCIYYNVRAAKEEFARVMRQVDFGGNMVHVSNAFYARAVLEGVAPAVIGLLANCQNPKNKIKRLGLNNYKSNEDYDDYF